MKQRIVVPYQLPEFVRAEYPAFVEFLQAYYQWLEEEYNIGRVSDLVDIDRTLDDFVDYFRAQLDVYGITRVDPYNRLILKNIRELYQAKGSNAGFDFLFKILFNKTSSIIEPWDYVLIPSNGNWIQDTSILVKATIGNVWGLQGNSAVVRDDLGRGYQIFVRNIVERPGNIFELYINRISPQAKLTSIRSIETLDQVIEAEILSTVSSAKIRKSGKGFRVGQIFNIGSYSGSGTLCKVKTVDSEGGIIAVEILRFGAGFQTNFSILLDPPDSPAMYAPSRIEIQKNLLEPKIFPSLDTVDAQDFSGSIVKHDYTNEDYMMDLTYVGQSMAEFINTGSNPNSAVIDFYVGQYCVYPGYYRDSNNIIGDLVYIQDSYYYQAFSYVTVIEESLDSYKAILRDVLHPSGTNHFAVHQINSSFNLQINVEAALNVLNKEDAIRDFVVSFDAIASFVISVVWNETVSPIDLLKFSVQKPLGDTDFAIADDLISLRPTISLGDTDFAVVDDLINIIPGKAFYSPIAITESLELTNTKYLEHQVSLTTGANSGAALSPYVDIISSPYWDFEYVDTEREFTN